MANIQIPAELFFRLVDYHLINGHSDELQKQISDELQKKLDKMVNQHYYSLYKTSVNPEEREKARQEYLDRKGIHKNFRW